MLREIIDDIRRWITEGRPVALATVISTWGSAPRSPGSKMAVTADGEMSGSVSAGCVEGAVVDEAMAVLQDGTPRKLRYGVADDSAWSVGLACGGDIEIYVEALPDPDEPDILLELARALDAQEPVVRATVIGGQEQLMGRSMLIFDDGRRTGSLQGELDEQVAGRARQAREGGVSGPETIGQVQVFFDVLLPSSTLLMVGGVHIAVDLAALARALGYRVVIVDPRRSFASPERFPDADQILTLWPDKALDQFDLTAGTAVAVLSHDPKIDDPAIIRALRSPAFYVGALGSKRTNRLRQERLLQAGLSETELARLRAPIGLALNGRSPEEIALSIMAEIVAVRSGSPLASR
jgi:xanthine dehydrogenase accessory factor